MPVFQPPFAAVDPGAVETALKSRFINLILEHRDLDSMISALADQAGCDELLVARLKKRKLQIRDEIMRVEGVMPGKLNATAPGDSTAHP